MTTVVVARKGGTVAIAADTLVTFGDTRLAHGYEANMKLFKVGDSWIGMAGTTAHFPVLRRALEALPPGEGHAGAPARPYQAGPHPLGGSADVLVGRGSP